MSDLTKTNDTRGQTCWTCKATENVTTVVQTAYKVRMLFNTSFSEENVTIVIAGITNNESPDMDGTTAELI